MAKVYFTGHHEALIADAIPIVEEWIATGVFGKRAAREWAQRHGANVITFVKTPERCSDTRIPAQHSCAKVGAPQ